MDSRTVTAVVPAFNMERYVEEALLSAIGQTYSQIEILVIDDGSTDDTKAVVERVAKDHSAVRLISTANAGVAAARNLGIRMARSPYVAFLDADDLWHPLKIERQVAALAAHGHSVEWGACYALYRMVDALDQVLGDGPASDQRGDFFDEHLVCNPVGNGSNLLVRRDLALAVGGFNPDYARRGIGGCEDLEFQLKLLRRTRMEVVREYLLGYRLHPAQMSGNVVMMRLGHVAVIEAVSAECSLPRSLRDRAMVHGYLTAAKGFLLVRQWQSVMKWLAAAMMLDPLETVRRVAALFREELGYWPRRLMLRFFPKAPASTMSDRFGTFDPHERFDDRRGISVKYRSALLGAPQARSNP